jgi:hypothetical protein
MRTIIKQDPYSEIRTEDWSKAGTWPTKWIVCKNLPAAPFVTAYRCSFNLAGADTIRLHISADERYELYLDGEFVGRGSERGDGSYWFFETYDIPMKQGSHTLAAKVWSLGSKAAFAQMSVHPGFILSPRKEHSHSLMATGIARWEAKVLKGYEFIDPLAAWGTGANLILHGDQMDWEWQLGKGDGWQEVDVLDPGADALQRNETAPTHMMRPAILPPMIDTPVNTAKVRNVSAINTLETHAIPILKDNNLSAEQSSWESLFVNDLPLSIPAHTSRRILVDLQNYYCAYPNVMVTGGEGSVLRIHWQESLYNEPDAQSKGNRDEIEGKYFVTLWHLKDGVGDTFLPDGGRLRNFRTLWWQAGRYIEIVVQTQDSPLQIDSLHLQETRYPLEMECSFSTAHDKLMSIQPIAMRALQMCSHETYMDCPYYEQLMYVGDTRLEALTTYVVNRNCNLPRKALMMFDASRQLNGLTQSRYPTRVRQIIPPFSLWWVGMVHDYALWRGEPAFLRSLMPGVRGVMDHFSSLRNSNGLIEAPIGWNYMDWCPEWKAGVPPEGAFGVSGILNLQYVLALTMQAKVEGWIGEPELAHRAKRFASKTMKHIQDVFWDEHKGLFADTAAHDSYSEHSQCLAILSDMLKPSMVKRIKKGLLEYPDLTRTTIYYTHYLFETYYKLGMPEAILDRLQLWFTLKDMGLKTTIEHPEPSRSDCHGWGSHPLYHFFASILGIRPSSPGFCSVRIEPQLGSLKAAHGILVHPEGMIDVDLKEDEGSLTGTIILPENVSGVLVYGGKQSHIHSGEQQIHEWRRNLSKQK